MENKFPDSELILNPDGSVYHLNLLPEDISDTVITVGDPDRVSVVSKFFDRIELKKQKREFITHTGIYKGKRITVLSTGIGTDNIEIVFNELDALVNIDLKKRIPKEKTTSLRIIRIGTSGALQADIPTDAFVFSLFGLGFDGLMNFYDHQNTSDENDLLESFISHFGNFKKIARPYLYASSSELEKTISDGMVKGITATCPGFYAPQGRVLRYRLEFPDFLEKLNSFRSKDLRITNFEMETSAMCGLASLLGHKTCSVNAIVANRFNKNHTKNAERTMDNMIETVLTRLSKS